jgi:hypothetical protein
MNNSIVGTMLEKSINLLMETAQISIANGMK